MPARIEVDLSVECGESGDLESHDETTWITLDSNDMAKLMFQMLVSSAESGGLFEPRTIRRFDFIHNTPSQTWHREN